MTKVDFVNSLPLDMPAKEVVARGRKRGLAIAEQYVYVIRSNSRAAKRNGNGHAETTRNAEFSVEIVPPKNGSGFNQSDRSFAQHALNIGLVRAAEILELISKIGLS